MQKPYQNPDLIHTLQDENQAKYIPQPNQKLQPNTIISEYELYMLSWVLSSFYDDVKTYLPEGMVPQDAPTTRSRNYFPIQKIAELHEQQAINIVDHTEQLRTTYELYKFNIQNRNETLFLGVLNLKGDENQSIRILQRLFAPHNDQNTVTLPIPKNTSTNLIILEILNNPELQAFGNIKFEDNESNQNLNQIYDTEIEQQTAQLIHNRLIRKFETLLESLTPDQQLTKILKILSIFDEVEITTNSLQKIQNHIFANQLISTEENLKIINSSNSITNYITSRLANLCILLGQTDHINQQIQNSLGIHFQQAIPIEISTFLLESSDRLTIHLPEITDFQNSILLKKLYKSKELQNLANVIIQPNQCPTNTSLHIQHLINQGELEFIQKILTTRIERNLNNSIRYKSSEEKIDWLLDIFEDINYKVVSLQNLAKIQEIIFNWDLTFPNTVQITQSTNSIEEKFLTQILQYIEEIEEKQKFIPEQISSKLITKLNLVSNPQATIPETKPSTPEKKENQKFPIQKIISGKTLLLPTDASIINSIQSIIQQTINIHHLPLQHLLNFTQQLRLTNNPNQIHLYQSLVQIFEGKTNRNQVQIAQALLKINQAYLYNPYLSQLIPNLEPINQIFAQIIKNYIDHPQLVPKLEESVQNFSANKVSINQENNIITISTPTYFQYIGNCTLNFKISLLGSYDESYDNIVDLLPYGANEPQLSLTPYIFIELENGIEILIQHGAVFNQQGVSNLFPTS